MLSIAFSGGGTGGHIYPGLAVAARLKERLDCRIFWIGSRAGMDRSIVEAGGVPFFGVPAGRLRRYFSLKTIPDIFRVAAGFFAARRILKKERPALLFSKGGFVSVPPCAAARSLGIPVFTHESDFSPGLATRINARFVKNGGRIFTAYEKTGGFFPETFRPLVQVTGNPVRPAFRDADAAKGREFLGVGGGERIFLVLGGSQGAAELNALVRQAFDRLTALYTVVHQTGPGNDWDIQAGPRYRPYPYIGEEMPHVIAAAELVLGRSGAGTVWECAALARPMILLPLSGSGTRGDQVENARYFRDAGAALILEGEGAGVTADELVRMVEEVSADTERREAMSAEAKRIGEADAAALIAASLANFLQRGAAA